MLDQILALVGLSQKGKNRIRENGSRWMVLEERETVGFTSERGPWILVAPIKESRGNNFRWVHKSTDKDFRLE